MVGSWMMLGMFDFGLFSGVVNREFEMRKFGLILCLAFCFCGSRVVFGGEDKVAVKEYGVYEMVELLRKNRERYRTISFSYISNLDQRVLMQNGVNVGKVVDHIAETVGSYVAEDYKIDEAGVWKGRCFSEWTMKMIHAGTREQDRSYATLIDGGEGKYWQDSGLRVYGIIGDANSVNRVSFELTDRSIWQTLDMVGGPWGEVNLFDSFVKYDAGKGLYFMRLVFVPSHERQVTFENEFEIDLSKGGIPVMWRSLFNGKVSMELQFFDYEKTKEGLWFASGAMAYSQHGNEAEKTLFTAEFFDVEINGDFGDERFAFAFPRGTILTDERTGRESLIKGKSYFSYGLYGFILLMVFLFWRRCRLNARDECVVGSA